jgi:hypothetical protein
MKDGNLAVALDYFAFLPHFWQLPERVSFALPQGFSGWHRETYQQI